MEIHHKIEVIMKEDDINKAWGVTDLLTQRCTTQINRLLSVFEDFQRLTIVGDARFTFRDTQEIGVPPEWFSFIGDTKIYTEELKTLDAYKVLLENVVVEPGDQWAHYQAVAAAVHLEMMSIYCEVRDKIKKERPPCTCNKSYHQHDCKWTCPKLQFMIQNKFYRKDNPGGFHGYPEALAAKRRRFENEARAAETDAGYDSDGSEALVCVPVRSGTANF